ncbi:MAG: DUF1365 domain-containing protein [Bacteroidia bacterium]|nr:DUF1365 domain-containing protein [Bacteroidia bacterium]
MHHRLEPFKRSFHYDVFMFYIDLDELEILTKKLFFFSRNAFNLFSFKDSEHLQLPKDNPDKKKPVKAHLLTYLTEQGMDTSDMRIMLLTNLNTLGYNFNPVSFYYCFNEQREPLCCVAEIGNTFGEQKPFYMNRSQFRNERFKQQATKNFYVSPFIDHDTDFDFNLGVPGDKLSIKIDDYKNGKRFFISMVKGVRRKLNNRNMLLYALRFPLIPLQIITLIHWHALVLWIKGLPFHRKSDFPELQQNVFKKFND